MSSPIPKKTFPLLVVLLGLWLAPVVASAQSRVAVVDFNGTASGHVRDMAASSVSAGEGVELVASKEVLRAANSLGVSEDDYAAIGAELRVSAFIQGTVRRRGRRWSAVISAYSGASGEKMGSS
ncbi:MAG: hypothetical protein KC416_12515, partial [Myxococcales bacterium]|nr:hypothetical protein [Myxococcales bacterium]